MIFLRFRICFSLALQILAHLARQPYLEKGVESRVVKELVALDAELPSNLASLLPLHWLAWLFVPNFLWESDQFLNCLTSKVKELD
jgi:hypothetical protein